MSKADFKKIQKLLKKLTAYKISKATGIGSTTISRWVTGKTPIEKMSLENAIKLTDYAEELEMEKEQEILEIIKEMELEPDMLDIWENEDGDINIQGRGMAPADEKELNLKYVGYVDNGEVYFE